MRWLRYIGCGDTAVATVYKAVLFPPTYNITDYVFLLLLPLDHSHDRDLENQQIKSHMTREQLPVCNKAIATFLTTHLTYQTMSPPTATFLPT